MIGPRIEDSSIQATLREVLDTPSALFYLAGPVRLEKAGMARLWRDVIKILLHGKGLSSFDPAAAWLAGDKSVEQNIEHANDAAIAVCTGVIVGWTGLESTGTRHDVAEAIWQRKPIFVIRIVGGLELPGWLQGFACYTLMEAIVEIGCV